MRWNDFFQEEIMPWLQLYSHDLLSFSYILYIVYLIQLIKSTLELSDFIHSMWPSYTYYKIQTLKSHLNIVHICSTLCMLPISDHDYQTITRLPITGTMYIHKHKSKSLQRQNDIS